MNVVDRKLKISYVLMSFPSPTQTFAGNDLLQLRKMGHQVDVYTLLASDSNADVLKNERSLEDVPVSALTAYNYFLGCAHILLRPLVFFEANLVNFL